MTPYLFVYGTLRRAARTKWSRELEAASDFVSNGRTQGLLIQLHGYRGMTPSDDPNAWVDGELHRLHDPAAMLPMLDAYEGSEFERRVVAVTLDDGTPIDSWAYIYIGQTS